MEIVRLLEELTWGVYNGIIKKDKQQKSVE